MERDRTTTSAMETTTGGDAKRVWAHEKTNDEEILRTLRFGRGNFGGIGISPEGRQKRQC